MSKPMEESYFHEMYRDSDDPWGFATRWYEQRKYALTSAVLSKRRYRRAFEAGCSIGVFTEQLALRCDEVLAVDLSPKAIDIARRRLVPFADRVTVESSDFVEHWPTGEFDLIVLSEVLYYLDEAQLDAVITQATDALADDGEVVAVHWRWPVPEYPSTGDRVHERLHASDLFGTANYVDDDFRLDVFVRAERPTIAQHEGLV